jgi:pyruvate/2-oxoglutarate dehydrogenase complex dihydrolipoamide acyltransferase (E2) component
MGILSNIFHKIFPSSHPAVTGTPAQAPQAAPAAPQAAPAQPAQQQQQQQPQQQQQQQQAAAPAAMPEVDVEGILTNMQASSGQQLNWRTSIVDLLKLLGLDSSLQARKELAAELHYSGDTNDSASMNVWLHRQVMNKLAANGGKVPADLKD